MVFFKPNYSSIDFSAVELEWKMQWLVWFSGLFLFYSDYDLLFIHSQFSSKHLHTNLMLHRFRNIVFPRRNAAFSMLNRNPMRIASCSMATKRGKKSTSKSDIAEGKVTALNMALKQIEAQFGKGSLMKLGSRFVKMLKSCEKVSKMHKKRSFSRSIFSLSLTLCFHHHMYVQ